MRHLINLTSLALLVGCFAGCHHWANKRVAAVSYANSCDPCATAAPVLAPINAVGSPAVVSKALPSGIVSQQMP
jgi:hypothetical protein